MAFTGRLDVKERKLKAARNFIGGFKECTFDTWGLYKDANQAQNVSLICWAVGI